MWHTALQLLLIENKGTPLNGAETDTSKKKPNNRFYHINYPISFELS